MYYYQKKVIKDYFNNTYPIWKIFIKDDRGLFEKRLVHTCHDIKEFLYFCKNHDVIGSI